MNNLFQNTLEVLDNVYKIKKFDDFIIKKFNRPNRDVAVSIPVTMDDGSKKIFEGYRVEYDNTLGPYKGGIRFHQDTDINEVKALALLMTLKCSLAGIPMGGGKGGVTVNPRELSKTELEKLSRGWARAFSDILGPEKDVPAPDVNTTPEIMTWMNDEYMKLTGEKTLATFTGKPLGQGGSEGRTEATGFGGFYTFNALREKLGLPEKCKVAIQGFGNVGFYLAKAMVDHGHTLIAISDSKGGVYNENGLDLEALDKHKKETGSLADFSGSENITNEALLELNCDVLAPAALENAINENNANNIKAKVILELANGPTTSGADKILSQKNIKVIPDILANSGGVIVSYFEWDQNLKNENWTKEEVLNKLQEILKTNSTKVFETSEKNNTTLRSGAFVLALERIEEKLCG